MKLATIKYQDRIIGGLVREDNFYSFNNIDKDLPDNMLDFIDGYYRNDYKNLIENNLNTAKATCHISEVEILAPLQNPPSFRDFMGFAEHIENTVKLTGSDRPHDNYYKFPVFYFSNHLNMLGQSDFFKLQPSTKAQDFEFEIGVIIGKKGINISKENAGDHIFGFTILNDWSARDLQMDEMPVNLGPAKGKDYATTIGPFIITKDEMDKYLLADDNTRYDLKTRLTLNGKVLRENNTKTILHTYASMIERASKDVMLYPGEIIGSGTIGGGCILEYSQDEVPFLKKGDVIEIEVEGIGKLVNKVI